MDALLIATAIGQLMDQPGIAMEVEDDGLVGGEQVVELPVAEPVGVLLFGHQRQQIHHVDEAHLQVGKLLAHDGGCRQGFLRGNVTAGNHHHIRLIRFGATIIVASPIPDAETLGAVLDGLFHAEVLQVLLLVCHDDVGVVGAAEAVIHHRQ